MNDIDRMADEIAEMAAQIDSATHRLLSRIREFDEAGGWGQQGARDCAHWLSWRIGLGLGTAREKVRVARALGTLPLIDDAFRRGALSYAKVRAMTRIARPETEAALVDLARSTTGAQLERVCRGYRAVDTPDPPQDERRYVRKQLLLDGRVKIEMVLETDEAAIVMKAIDGATSTLREDVSAETRPSRADGARLVAETFLEKGPTAGTGGDRTTVMVHLEQDVLGPDGQLSATLEDGVLVPAETLRRVACDTGLLAAVVDEKRRPLDVGRKTRSIPPAIRRALEVRDRGCTFPGCSRKVCHGHHVEPWLEGGETKIENLLQVCAFHHWLVHEGGFHVRTEGDAFVFRRPDGSVIPKVGPPVQVEDGLLDVRQSNLEAGVEIDAWVGCPEGDLRGNLACALEDLLSLRTEGASSSA